MHHGSFITARWHFPASSFHSTARLYNRLRNGLFLWRIIPLRGGLVSFQRAVLFSCRTTRLTLMLRYRQIVLVLACVYVCVCDFACPWPCLYTSICEVGTLRALERRDYQKKHLFHISTAATMGDKPKSFYINELPARSSAKKKKQVPNPKVLIRFLTLGHLFSNLKSILSE